MANKNTQSGKKWAAFWTGLIAFIIIAAMLAGVMGWRTGGFKDWTFGFGTEASKPDDTPNTGDPVNPDNPDDVPNVNTSSDGNLIITPDAAGVSAMSYAIEPLTERAANGTVKVVKDSYTVTITYTPSYLNGVKIDWSTNWKETSGNTWSNGRSVSQYMTVTPTDEYGISAQLRTNNAFGTPIEVTAAVHNNPELKVAFVLDYVQSATTNNLEIGGNDFSDNFDVSYTVSFGTGTVRGNFEASSATLFILDEFEADLKARLSFSARLITSVNITSVMALKSKLTEYGGKIYLSFEGTTIDWSWFFPDFESYSQNQKNEIYYAWYNTYSDGYVVKHNIEVTFQGYYKYNGVTVGDINGDVTGWLSGDCDGSDIQVTSINGGGNIVFYNN